MLNNCGEAFNLYLPSTLKKLVTTWTAKYFFGSIVFSRVWSSAGIGHWKATLIFIKDLLEDEQCLSMGGMLALLKYPFYPLFNFDNGMNLISKSLTILTSGQLLVVCTYILEVLRFCRFLTNFGAWNDEAHDHAMTRRMTKAKARTKDRRPWWLEARSCTSTLQ